MGRSGILHTVVDPGFFKEGWLTWQNDDGTYRDKITLVIVLFAFLISSLNSPRDGRGVAIQSTRWIRPWMPPQCVKYMHSIEHEVPLYEWLTGMLVQQPFSSIQESEVVSWIVKILQWSLCSDNCPSLLHSQRKWEIQRHHPLLLRCLLRHSLKMHLSRENAR